MLLVQIIILGKISDNWYSYGMDIEKVMKGTNIITLKILNKITP